MLDGETSMSHCRGFAMPPAHKIKRSIASAKGA